MTVGDGSSGRLTRDRFYRFSHSIDSICGRQLLCSGAVQWWNRTAPSNVLLEQWQRVIERSIGSADDKCLDHAFKPEVAYVFPKDCLIDTHSRTLLRLSNQVWRPVARFSIPLWL